jgi:hypothetical protein
MRGKLTTIAVVWLGLAVALGATSLVSSKRDPGLMVVSASPERRLGNDRQLQMRPYGQEIEAYDRLERHLDEADRARLSGNPAR